MIKLERDDDEARPARAARGITAKPMSALGQKRTSATPQGDATRDLFTPSTRIHHKNDSAIDARGGCVSTLRRAFIADVAARCVLRLISELRSRLREYARESAPCNLREVARLRWPVDWLFISRFGTCYNPLNNKYYSSLLEVNEA